jgi:hypothetical protein
MLTAAQFGRSAATTKNIVRCGNVGTKTGNRPEVGKVDHHRRKPVVTFLIISYICFSAVLLIAIGGSWVGIAQSV